MTPNGTGNSITSSPFIDELTAEFTKRAILAHEPGTPASPELLTVSFSGLDKVGHIYGRGATSAWTRFSGWIASSRIC